MPIFNKIGAKFAASQNGVARRDPVNFRTPPSPNHTENVGWSRRLAALHAWSGSFEVISVKLLLSGGMKLFSCELLETHVPSTLCQDNSGTSELRRLQGKATENSPLWKIVDIKTVRKGHLNVCAVHQERDRAKIYVRNILIWSRLVAPCSRDHPIILQASTQRSEELQP